MLDKLAHYAQHTVLGAIGLYFVLMLMKLG